MANNNTPCSRIDFLFHELSISLSSSQCNTIQQMINSIRDVHLANRSNNNNITSPFSTPNLHKSTSFVGTTNNSNSNSNTTNDQAKQSVGWFSWAWKALVEEQQENPTNTAKQLDNNKYANHPYSLLSTTAFL